jgi:hypothetical protein
MKTASDCCWETSTILVAKLDAVRKTLISDPDAGNRQYSRTTVIREGAEARLRADMRIGKRRATRGGQCSAIIQSRNYTNAPRARATWL